MNNWMIGLTNSNYLIEMILLPNHSDNYFKIIGQLELYVWDLKSTQPLYPLVPQLAPYTTAFCVAGSCSENNSLHAPGIHWGVLAVT